MTLYERFRKPYEVDDVEEEDLEDVDDDEGSTERARVARAIEESRRAREEASREVQRARALRVGPLQKSSITHKLDAKTQMGYSEPPLGAFATIIMGVLAGIGVYTILFLVGTLILAQ